MECLIYVDVLKTRCKIAGQQRAALTPRFSISSCQQVSKGCRCANFLTLPIKLLDVERMKMDLALGKWML